MMDQKYAITMYSKAYLGVKALPDNKGNVEPRLVWSRKVEDAAAFASQYNAAQFIETHHLIKAAVVPIK